MKNFNLKFKGAIIIIGLLIINGFFTLTILTTITNYQTSPNALTATYQSLSLFPVPLPFIRDSSFYLFNHSAFVYGAWTNTSNFERDILSFNFNNNFTRILNVQLYNVSFIHNMSIYRIATDGYHFYLLGMISPNSYAIIVLNSISLDINKTLFLNCSSLSNIATIPFNSCYIDDMTIWNNSLWLIEEFDNTNTNIYSKSLVAYTLSSFNRSYNFTISNPSSSSSGPLSANFISISVLSGKLLLNIPNNDILLPTNYDYASYRFDPTNNQFTKIIWTSVISNQDEEKLYSYLTDDTHDLIALNRIAIDFLTTIDSGYPIIGFAIWTIAPTIPPFPLLPLLLNVGIYGVLAIIAARDKKIRTFSKSFIEKVKLLRT